MGRGTDLVIVGRRNTVHVACDLRAKVRDADEFGKDVLREDECVARLPNVVRGHVDVVGTEMQVRGGDGAHSP